MGRVGRLGAWLISRRFSGDSDKEETLGWKDAGGWKRSSWTVLEVECVFGAREKDVFENDSQVEN